MLVNKKYATSQNLTYTPTQGGVIYRLRINPGVYTIELQPKYTSYASLKCKGSWKPGAMLLVMGKGVYEVHNKNFTFE
jgi:hypothetical protein